MRKFSQLLEKQKAPIKVESFFKLYDLMNNELFNFPCIALAPIE